ncbi:MAG: ARPP-1 family domain-containing protein [bacterium]
MSWKIGDLTFSRNLGLFPIFGNGQVATEVISLQEGLENGWISVRETGAVEKVVVEHHSGPDVLLLDGEEVVGAFQNRVFVTSVWMEAGQKASVPVVCVEAGRWNGENVFRSAGFSAYPSLRAKTSYTLYQSLKGKRVHQADQSEVWNEVDSMLETLRISSATRLMSDSFRKSHKELASYLDGVTSGSARKRNSSEKKGFARENLEELIKDLPVLEGQTGFLAFTQRRILGADIFGNESIFRKFYGKLLLSYLLDALADSLKEGGDMDADCALNFLSRAEKWKQWKPFPAVAKGQEFWYASSGVIGKSLSANGGFLHLSLFPAPVGKSKRGGKG